MILVAVTSNDDFDENYGDAMYQNAFKYSSKQAQMLETAILKVCIP